jgi:hypothetical protein
LRLEHAKIVAPAGLDAAHGQCRIAHDFFLCTVVGVHRYANGTTQTRDQPLHLHGLGHAGNDAVRRHATQLGTATDQQRILTAEHAAGFHFNALGGGNAARCFQQQRIADSLAEPVVQPLKTVQPHVHHTERTASLFDALYLLLHWALNAAGLSSAVKLSRVATLAN